MMDDDVFWCADCGYPDVACCCDDILPEDADGEDICQRCNGDGGFHDCGEDTCCCDLSSPHDPDWWPCPDCGG